MPKLANMKSTSLPGAGNYHFSAVRPETLESTEYTVVSIILDTSSSVSSFKQELVDVQKFIVEACQKSPRKDNLLLRVTHFNANIKELHGFRPLSDVDLDDYNATAPTGATALFDATDTGVQATLTYAQDLAKNDYFVNAAIYVVTDGGDNCSTRSPKDIKKRITDIMQSEDLESVIIVLVGITGGNHQLQQYLDDFAQEVGITQYVDIGAATSESLARLANFISKSISNQSQALGSGGASAPLTF